MTFRTMKKLVGLLAVLAALVGAGSASAGCDLPGNVLANTTGFRTQLSDSVRPFSSPQNALARLALLTPVTYCGPGAAAAAAALKATRRFYTLLAAFPAHPSAAQWRARWRPLVAAAAEVDTDYLGVLRDVFAADSSYPMDRVALTQMLRADLGWLVAHERTAFGKPVR